VTEIQDFKVHQKILERHPANKFYRTIVIKLDHPALCIIMTVSKTHTTFSVRCTRVGQCSYEAFKKAFELLDRYFFQTRYPFWCITTSVKARKTVILLWKTEPTNWHQTLSPKPVDEEKICERKEKVKKVNRVW